MSQLWNNIAATAKLGGAYLEHSQFIKTALLAPPEQRSDLVARYQKGLSPAGLIGFKLCLQYVAVREKDDATKAAIVSLMEGAQVGFTDFLTATLAAVRGPTAVSGDDPALRRDCEYFEALLGMASDAERAQDLARHVESLDREGLARFGAHLDMIESNLNDQIKSFAGGDPSAWGSTPEDRMAYGMAHLGAPAPRPSTSPRLAQLNRGLAVVEQMKRARSRAALQGQISKLVAGSSDMIGRITAAVSARGSQADEPVAATATVPDPAMLDLPGGHDPRVARIVEIFTRHDLNAQFRFLADSPDVPAKADVLAIFGRGERALDYAALLVLCDPYCRGVDPASGTAIAKAVYVMAQAAADAAPSGEMVDLAAQAAIMVLLGYTSIRAAIDPVAFGAEASAWLDRHGHTQRRVQLLLSRI